MVCDPGSFKLRNIGASTDPVGPVGPMIPLKPLGPRLQQQSFVEYRFPDIFYINARLKKR
jgi:hypothetical protein